MKKIDYYIATGKTENNDMVYGFELVVGYLENFTAPDGTEIEIGLRKIKYKHIGDVWTADELTTGYSIGKHADTRMRLLNMMMDDDLLQRIADVLRTEKCRDAQRRMDNYIKQHIIIAI